MAVSLAITNLRAAERDAVFRQNLKRLGGQPCIGLTLIDEKPGCRCSFMSLAASITVQIATPAQRSGGDGITGTSPRSAISNALWDTVETAEGGQSTTMKS